MGKMQIVCHTEQSCMAYPEVTPNVTAWVWSDKPDKGTVLVTEHGLRRLLRLASIVHRLAAAHYDKHFAELYRDDLAQEKLMKAMNEGSAIFCEGDLVMSRLFVDDQGRAISHKDKEIDQAGIPPWEKSNRE